MNFHDLLQLPAWAAALFALIIWPAVWAAILAVIAFAGDFERMRQRRHTVRSDGTHRIEQHAN